jgi:hypothetical protein
MSYTPLVLVFEIEYFIGRPEANMIRRQHMKRFGQWQYIAFPRQFCAPAEFCGVKKQKCRTLAAVLTARFEIMCSHGSNLYEMRESCELGINVHGVLFYRFVGALQRPTPLFLPLDGYRQPARQRAASKGSRHACTLRNRSLGSPL